MDPSTPSTALQPPVSFYRVDAQIKVEALLDNAVAMVDLESLLRSTLAQAIVSFNCQGCVTTVTGTIEATSTTRTRVDTAPF